MTLFLSIKVHFQGVFINKPFCYSDGFHHVLENIDFVDIAYQRGVQVPVYMDHFGTTVHVTKANENENEDNCYVKYNISIEREEGIDLTDFMSPQQSNMEGVTYEGVSQTNGNKEVTEGDQKDDEYDNVPYVKGKPMFNEDIHWKKKLTILDNWKWFLENLQEDLHLEGGFGKTLMSDQHNGIIEAVKDLFPEIKHRASTKPLFISAMKGIQMISPAAYVHLIGRNPNSWSRAFFSNRKGDIRLYVMHRMCSLRQKGSGWGHFDVCPNIRFAINELKAQQRYWQVIPSSLDTFETRNLGESYGVDLEKKTCACRIWQMNGYGCVQSVVAISYVKRDVETFVDPLYCDCIYMNTYKYSIKCMNGIAMWPPTDYIPPLPPLKRKMLRRPTVKRKRDNTKVSGPHIVSKVGKKIICGVYKKSSHTKSTCDAMSKAQKSQVIKRKVEGEGETSALRKGNGQGQCGSTSGVIKKNGEKIGM
ncbi:unnamed protein product [Lactuca saligna]|uniref:SWIM-type domain-containing protein n=1 Tax=Lactuca saligna TaxID=75948 RepID=A0AA35ZQU5_LACSI|nr:unnamed protein product [Lactuca saligna]